MTLHIQNPGYSNAPPPGDSPEFLTWLTNMLSRAGTAMNPIGSAKADELPLGAAPAAGRAPLGAMSQPGSFTDSLSGGQAPVPVSSMASQTPVRPPAPPPQPPPAPPTPPPAPPAAAAPQPPAGPMAAADAAGPAGLAYSHMPAPGQGPGYGMQHAVLQRAPPVRAQPARPVTPTPASAYGPGRTPGAPNLGYYAPMSGNARGAQPMQYQDPNDPRIFKGPLATYGRT